MYYPFLRLVNVLSVLMLVGSGAAMLLMFPAGRVGLVGLALLLAWRCRRGPALTAYGTARPATRRDIPRELEPGGGLCVGELIGEKVGRVEAFLGLFSRRLDAETAVKELVASGMRKQPAPRVTLNDAVHTVACAPTGAGKNAFLIGGQLLTCPDTMVVVDIKGENALLSAEHRAREFGHEIYIIDPFNEVTHA